MLNFLALVSTSELNIAVLGLLEVWLTVDGLLTVWTDVLQRRRASESRRYRHVQR